MTRINIDQYQTLGRRALLRNLGLSAATLAGGAAWARRTWALAICSQAWAGVKKLSLPAWVDRVAAPARALDIGANRCKLAPQEGMEPSALWLARQCRCGGRGSGGLLDPRAHAGIGEETK